LNESEAIFDRLTDTQSRINKLCRNLRQSADLGDRILTAELKKLQTDGQKRMNKEGDDNTSHSGH
jgi:gamma-glutamyl phosphate reductase